MTLTRETLENVLSARPVRFYERTDSTNDLALEWLRQGAASGATVIADEQLKGRGRKGRTWHTPPGVALAVSVVLHPPVEALHQVSMLGALAIAELCEQLSPDAVAIKWPNDVQIAGRKVSGVLPETAWDGDKLAGVALGMGVNVRVDFTGTELEDKAVSLETVTGTTLDRALLLHDLLLRVDYWSARLGSAALFDAWKRRLNTIGQPITILDANIRGIAQAVDRQGALLVRDAEGRVQRIMAGDLALG